MRKCALSVLLVAASAMAVGQVFIRAQVPAQGVTAAGPPMFSKDIAPIFYKNCASCHQPNSIAPMSLLDFASARPYARSIQRAVEARTMPPWLADPKYRSVPKRLSTD